MPKTIKKNANLRKTIMKLMQFFSSVIVGKNKIKIVVAPQSHANDNMHVYSKKQE